ncbi:hypothetical protein [Mangrovimonas sp. DI 80]|uniref:hypothetical protein n=1 Tax=Mangrovimonas sp. DI 80 TaxID=1779330 RepID=UPI000977D8D2|nr:hypothetical protein [Mangrovimonas sp. DI 80]OMP31928.1 hypothetical protein BKM32_02380 [Mangrovimonas sp. DI 80]
MLDAKITYRINGDFNSGLKIFLDDNLLMFSEVKRKWFSSDIIQIYAENKELLLVIKKKGVFKTLYHIEFQNGQLIDDVKSIEESFLSSRICFSGNKSIELKSSAVPFIGPNARIFYKNEEIGNIKIKKLAINLDYTLTMKKANFEYLSYLFILFLVKESNRDYD